MAHTFSNLLTHVIFSTQDRRPLLTLDLTPVLFAYMGGIIRNLHDKLIDSSAPLDHVHCLLSLPATLAVAEAMRLLKTNSSRWVHEIRRRPVFAWQTGFGAFSVSQSNLPAVLKYIRGQDQHHRKVLFQEEFITFLKRNEISYDERYVWESASARPSGACVSDWFLLPRLAPWATLWRPSGPHLRRGTSVQVASGGSTKGERSSRWTIRPQHA